MNLLDTSELLSRSRAGDRTAFDALYARLYEDLHSAARGQLRGHRSGDTLDTTALVHEAYVRLLGEQSVQWESRAHFLAVAARAMRRVIIDAARQRTAQKRGGRSPHVTLSSEVWGAVEDPHTLIAIDDALSRLAHIDERLPRVAECRLFAGLSEKETAGALDVSVRTVQRDWQRARAWLQQELS
jgi:RNA polymerase sigma factor (TIGR02999 family)